jgi:hypothetical protein
MREFKRETIERYMSTHIDLISALYREEKDWLRPREKEFLVYNLLLKSRGLDIKSSESVAELKVLMGFSSKDDVYNYRNRLKAKGWLEQTRDDIVFPSIIDIFRGEDSNTIKKKIDYKFSLKWVS